MKLYQVSGFSKYHNRFIYIGKPTKSMLTAKKTLLSIKKNLKKVKSKNLTYLSVVTIK